MFGGCSLWQGRVVIPVDTQRVHPFSIVGLAQMMNHIVSLWELQSGVMEGSGCTMLLELSRGIVSHL